MAQQNKYKTLNKNFEDQKKTEGLNDTKKKFCDYYQKHGLEADPNNKGNLIYIQSLTKKDGDQIKLSPKELTKANVVALFIKWMLSHKPNCFGYRTCQFDYKMTMFICECKYNVVEYVVAKLSKAGLIKHIESKKAAEQRIIPVEEYYPKHKRSYYDTRTGHVDKWVVVQVKELKFDDAGLRIVFIQWKKEDLLDRGYDVSNSFNNSNAPPEQQPGSVRYEDLKW